MSLGRSTTDEPHLLRVYEEVRTRRYMHRGLLADRCAGIHTEWDRGRVQRNLAIVHRKDWGDEACRVSLIVRAGGEVLGRKLQTQAAMSTERDKYHENRRRVPLADLMLAERPRPDHPRSLSPICRLEFSLDSASGRLAAATHQQELGGVQRQDVRASPAFRSPQGAEALVTKRWPMAAPLGILKAEHDVGLTSTSMVEPNIQRNSRHRTQRNWVRRLDPADLPNDLPVFGQPQSLSSQRALHGQADESEAEPRIRIRTGRGGNVLKRLNCQMAAKGADGGHLTNRTANDAAWLLKRQMEAELSLRSSLSTDTDIDTTRRTVGQLLFFFDELRRVADRLQVAQAALFQDLLRRLAQPPLTGTSDAKSPRRTSAYAFDVSGGLSAIPMHQAKVLNRRELLESTLGLDEQLSAEHLAELVAAVRALRALIRVKVEDTNDLLMAEDVIRAIAQFLGTLARYARDTGVTELTALQNLGRKRR